LVKPATGDATTKRSAVIFFYRSLNNLSPREVTAGYFGDDPADAGRYFGTGGWKSAKPRAIFMSAGIMFEDIPPSLDSKPRQSSAKRWIDPGQVANRSF
jgi:hypothetical protein